jgi:TnpA family transposase
LYHALKAFGQILKSIFILRVIDEPMLRMSIEKVLSAIEHVHAFTRAVSIGNPREFLQAEKEDQESMISRRTSFRIRSESSPQN